METMPTIPHDGTNTDDDDHRPSGAAIWKGMRRRCPKCGEKTLFAGYTKTNPSCVHCGQNFSGHRADDAPPYLTMMIVGHALAIPIVELKRQFDPPLGFQLILWLTIATVATLTILPMAKGGLIAFQWAKRMHGFGHEDDAMVDPTLTP